MNNLTHPIAPEEIMAFLDGELSTARTVSVSAHIRQCAECNETVSSFRKTSHSLSDWKVPPVPLRTEFEEHLSAAVASATWKLRDIRGPRFRVFPRRSWRLGAASIACAAVLFILIRMSTERYGMSFSAARSATEKEVREQQVTKGQGTLSGLSSPVTLNSPGIAADSNGLLLGLGDHVDNAVSLDGQPASDQQGKVFSNQIPRDSIESGQAVLPGPMIARTVALVMVVKQFDASRASLEGILARHKGYSSNLAINTPEGAARSLDASLRVPVLQLAATIAELKALGRVELETQGGEEVTQQHADLAARLKIARETEHRFIAILRDRPGNISEVLSTEESIARVRGEIEQMEAQQQNLEHRVDFATVNLRLAEEYKAQLSSPAPSVATQVRNASVNGFRGAFESVLAVVLFLAESGPAILLWLVLLLLPARMLWRRYRRSLALSSSLGA
jgi:hypothetical protein